MSIIKEIKMAGVASYDEKGITLKLKTFTLVYGLNGTGKTTISRYLADRQKREYENCSIDPEPRDQDQPKILVYNREYVGNVFYGKPTQEGVFILGEENAESQKAIEQAIKEIEILEPEKVKVSGEILTIKKKMEGIEERLEEGLFNRWKRKNMKKLLFIFV